MYCHCQTGNHEWPTKSSASILSVMIQRILLHSVSLSLLVAGISAADLSPTFPGKEWSRRSPAEAGLREADLKALADYAGGSGCVVRSGHLVFEWGNASRRRDVASAAKPLYTHFLLKAVADGRVAGFDEPVIRWEPRLEPLNADLGFKDRAITWRHLSNQISCYGSVEPPGAAFDYNDHNMALFFDTLMLKVYGATWENVDEHVLRPLLTDLLQCQDNPTFMAFGTGNRPGRLAISPRDFARFGLLYLREGLWGEQQLLPPDLARMAVSTPLPLSIPRTSGKEAAMIPGQRSIGGGGNQCDHEGSYSFAWWINGIRRDGTRNWPDVPADAFGCFGHGDIRAVVVLPSLDLVVSWNDTKIEGHEKVNHALKLLLPGPTAYHVDPASGSMANPGTQDLPWSTLEAVMAARKRFEAGDELVLHEGHHGDPVIRGRNTGEVKIRVAEGARATVQRLSFRAARHWRVQGLEISPQTAPAFKRATMVSVAADSSEITIGRCRLYTVRDAGGWSADDWDHKACNGIDVAGPDNVVRDNRLRNVNFGISITGARCRVERNIVENFSGDGLRGLGDYGVFDGNLVMNCYDVNGNHDDGFQSWSTGPGGVGTGVVRGVVLRGNRIVNYEDPAQPHRGTLQGIGCFDGFFEDWLIENNEILTDHWHGITLGGARNCRIVNNMVVDLNDERPGPPWIRIGRHKNGMPSSGNLIRNNLAPSIHADEGTAAVDHNLVLREPGGFFRDFARGDLRLREDSPAIDAGSPEKAPATDAGGQPRPVDGNGDGRARWDIGAREFVP